MGGGFEDEASDLIARIAAGRPAPELDAVESPLWSRKLLGTTLGQETLYTLHRVVGVGGMGAVFEAWTADRAMRVAVKVLAPPHQGTTERRRRRFLREVEAMARIESDHVVKILEWGDEPFEFLVMEFLEGEDLAHRIRRKTKLEWVEARRIAAGVVLGLIAAHRNGVVHRDLKPSNCFVMADGTVKLLDFGLALVEGADKVTRSNEAVGTALYMAPERFKSGGGKLEDLELDRNRAAQARLWDLYALGVIMFEMVTGTVPFDCSDLLGLALLISEQRPPNPSAAGAVIPERAEELILRLLEKDPRSRYQTAPEVLEILEGTLQGSGTRIRRRSSGRRWGASLAILSVAAAGLGALGSIDLPRVFETVPAVRSVSVSSVPPRPQLKLSRFPHFHLDLTVTVGTVEDEAKPRRSGFRARPKVVARVEVAEDLEEMAPSVETPVSSPEVVATTSAPVIDPVPTEVASDPPLSLVDVLAPFLHDCSRQGNGLRVDMTFIVKSDGRVSWAKARKSLAESVAGNCVEDALTEAALPSHFAGTHRVSLKL